MFSLISLITKHFVVDQPYLIDTCFFDALSLAPHILCNKEPCVFASWPISTFLSVGLDVGFQLNKA